jgi:hypothetical protein
MAASQSSPVIAPLYAERNGGWRLVPLIFFQVYLNFSVVTFAFGPWPWPIENHWELYAYLTVAHFALAAGYLWAARQSWQMTPPSPRTLDALFTIAIVLSLLLALPTSFSRTGSIVPDLAVGLEDPGEAYGRAVFRGQSGGEHVVFEYLRIMLSPLLALALPLLVACWSSFALWKRLLGSFAVLWVVSLYIATGTNKGVADFVLILPWLVILRRFSLGRFSLPVLPFTLAVVISIVLMLIFFTYGQLGREGGAAVGSVFGPPLMLTADSDHWLTSHVPDEVRIAVESLTRYLNAGYYALARCFRFDFDFNFLVGNSMFLSRNMDSLFETHITLATTYPAKLEVAEGWGVFALWHSIYPWLASDFGFLGTLLVVALIGWLFAASWISAVRTSHPASISLFAYLCIMLYYFPANNQLMQSGESCVGFLVTLAWWTIAVLRAQFRATEVSHARLLGKAVSSG